MPDALDGLNKSYVILRYHGPSRRDAYPFTPIAVHLLNPSNNWRRPYKPEITISTSFLREAASRLTEEPVHPDEVPGVVFLGGSLFRGRSDAETSAGRSGGALVLFQVGANVDWKIRVVHNKGYLDELHRIFISVPVFHVVHGPMVGILSRAPWFLKGPWWAQRIAQVFEKMEEVESIVGTIISRTRIDREGLTSMEGRIRFVNYLRILEDRLKSELGRKKMEMWQRDTGMAFLKQMERRVDGSSTFAGRIA